MRVASCFRVAALFTISATLATLTTSALAADPPLLEFGKKAYVVKAIECAVLIPNRWQATQDRTGMVAQVARNPGGAGFRITRQPLLAFPEDFAEEWKTQLTAAGKIVKVSSVRAGKYKGWKATWTSKTGGGRDIEVWRVHVPSVEMVYNISFSLPKNDPTAKLLLKGVARSFRCTVDGSAKMEFQGTASDGAKHVDIFLPKGFEKAPFVRQGMSAYGAKFYEKAAPGFSPRRISSKIGIWNSGSYPVRFQEGGEAGSPKDLVPVIWDKQKFELSEFERPRVKVSRVGTHKGALLTTSGKTKDGFAKEVFVFAGKDGQKSMVLIVIADAREVRLYRNYFKQICSKLKFRK